MYIHRIFFAVSFLSVSIGGNAQKPANIQINSFISRVPLPENSASCYASCTTTKDADGQISIKDNGPVFNDLTEQLEKLNKAAMDDMRNSGNTAMNTAPSAPTAEQIAEMQQQAMQRAQQAMQNGTNPAAAQSGNHPAKAFTTNVALMQEIGKAQSAIMPMNQLINELSAKVGQVTMEDVKAGPNCPEVQQGGYAGPTCKCTKEREISYESRCIAARDGYLAKVNALLHKYIPQIQDQVAIIDKLESDAKFGEGLTDRATLQMLVSLQREALNGFTSVLSIANGKWSDGANQYLRLVNAKNQQCP